MTDLQHSRRGAADEALADHDFEPDVVTASGSWDTDDDCSDEWTCLLSIQGPVGPYACGFVVQFGPGTAIVGEAYPATTTDRIGSWIAERVREYRPSVTPGPKSA